MRILFDTSALVAALISSHPQHQAARACLVENIQRDDVEVCVSSHALAELFAVLTRFPQWRVRADMALAIIEGIHPSVTVIALTEETICGCSSTLPHWVCRGRLCMTACTLERR